VTTSPLLEVKGVVKTFDGVTALAGASLDVRTGEVMALVGDNGAGKSTLIKVISGVHAADAGAITVEGREIAPGSVSAARAAGIETVYQDLGLVEPFNVVDNIYLGRERTFGRWPVLDKRRMRREARALVSRLNESLAPSIGKPVTYLSGGQRQAIALARCAAWGSKLVILDEPTAALGVRESEKALDLVRLLRSEGLSILIISHSIQHVFDVADRVTVLRRGKSVGSYDIGSSTPERVVALITGATFE
jgi:ABC-type sugar transport system ATPase subunit